MQALRDSGVQIDLQIETDVKNLRGKERNAHDFDAITLCGIGLIFTGSVIMTSCDYLYTL